MTTPSPSDRSATLRRVLDRDPEYRTTAENVMAGRIAELEAAIATHRDRVTTGEDPTDEADNELWSVLDAE